MDAHRWFPADTGKAAGAIITETALEEIGDRTAAGKRSILEAGISNAHAAAAPGRWLFSIRHSGIAGARLWPRLTLAASRAIAVEYLGGYAEISLSDLINYIKYNI